VKIVFICAVFPPEREPAGVMAQQLAARLAADGHSVGMIAPFPNRPYGQVYAGYRRRLRKVEQNGDGYRLVHCANWLVGRRRWSINRLLENITFGLSSAWSAWREGRPDVMIIETWPLFAAQFPALLAQWWGIPYLYYLQDVYPEAAEEVGVISNQGPVARFCRRWDRRLCLNSGRVVVISESMRELLSTSRGVPAEHFAVIPNWISATDFQTHPIENSWRREQGIAAGSFVAMFGGTMGHVSGAEVLVEAAALLRDGSDAQIFCVGEGVLKRDMMENARRRGLQNLRFLPFQPAERVPEVQAAANATILTIQPAYPDASVPSKLISYMAAGRAVICSAPSSSAVCRAVCEAEAGVTTEPGNPAAIAAAIRRLAADPAECIRMGKNARRYFETHYTLERAYGQFRDLLADLAPAEGGRRRAAACAPEK
jgi:colanic acid biosynthesis glycosyl transferase WcaI